VAGICDPSGRIFGMMPHPERAFLFLQRDDWPAAADRCRRAGQDLPAFADGAAIFRNAVK
jgi:phosphoribosylformylglycinamidine synthase